MRFREGDAADADAEDGINGRCVFGNGFLQWNENTIYTRTEKNDIIKEYENKKRIFGRTD